MTDIVFLDTETLGLDPTAPIWEFAAIRCSPGKPVQTREFFIEHDTRRWHSPPRSWLEEMPGAFVDDYRARYNRHRAYTEPTAAEEIHFITNGAVIVGAVPSFDTERLALLLRRNGIEPAWHYHLCDVENVVAGYLAGRGELMPPPWKSDELSAAVGVDPAKFARHTAMGDALWCQAQYHAVMGRPPGAAQRDGVLVRLYLDEDHVANLGVDDYDDGAFSLRPDHPRANWLRQHVHHPGLMLIVESDDDPERYVKQVDWSLTGTDPRVHISTITRRDRIRRSIATDAQVMATQEVEFA